MSIDEIHETKSIIRVNVKYTLATNCFAEFKIELVSRIIRFDVGLDVK